MNISGLHSDHPVYKYLNRIKNHEKKRYGFAYLAYVRNPTWIVEPLSHRYTLGVMAAQAVRIKIDQLLTGKGRT